MSAASKNADSVARKVYREEAKAILRGEGNTPSKWAIHSWAEAIREKIVDGTRPQGYATREQVATMLLRMKGEKE